MRVESQFKSAGMSMWDSIVMALRSLKANKMRSFLTMLGVIIGVGSVVTMVAIGSGARIRVAQEIASLGANVLMIVPGAARDAGVRKEKGSLHTLTETDARSVAEEVSIVAAAAPSVRASAQVVHAAKNWNAMVNGTTADYFVVREWALGRGRHFTQDEERGAGKVTLLGSTVAKQLFGEEDAVGQWIRVSGVPLNVIGILAEKGASGAGQDQDDVVFVPISTAKRRLTINASEVNRDAVSYILVKASREDAITSAVEQIEELLSQRHRIQADRPRDFQVTNPAETMKAQRAAETTTAWLLAAIASVSLVVGGISIMNIMLVSVSERTKEIGLRIAIGARRRDVRFQFLTEAVILCVVGGLTGIGVGAIAAWVVARLAGWPVYLGVDAILLALGFAAGIGVFFGYYPARKAALLEPVEALRSE